jgi:hypothetical protein
MNKVVTDFLTPKSSYLTGAGSVMNLAGSYFVYNISPTPDMADRRAIFSDWAMIGQDLRHVLEAEKQKVFKPKGQLELGI